MGPGGCCPYGPWIGIGGWTGPGTPSTSSQWAVPFQTDATRCSPLPASGPVWVVGRLWLGKKGWQGL